mmetsp:Transcript_27644/g.79546  ORF Transcript_27644/g.79546 Transcript_27644/m.79546 type:complete len:334 (+) Transcript_27644:2019-3020(+)
MDLAAPVRQAEHVPVNSAESADPQGHRGVGPDEDGHVLSPLLYVGKGVVVARPRQGVAPTGVKAGAAVAHAVENAAARLQTVGVFGRGLGRRRRGREVQCGCLGGGRLVGEGILGAAGRQTPLCEVLQQPLGIKLDAPHTLLLQEPIKVAVVPLDVFGHHNLILLVEELGRVSPVFPERRREDRQDPRAQPIALPFRKGLAHTAPIALDRVPHEHLDIMLALAQAGDGLGQRGEAFVAVKPTLGGLPREILPVLPAMLLPAVVEHDPPRRADHPAALAAVPQHVPHVLRHDIQAVGVPGTPAPLTQESIGVIEGRGCRGRGRKEGHALFGQAG